MQVPALEGAKSTREQHGDQLQGESGENLCALGCHSQHFLLPFTLHGARSQALHICSESLAQLCFLLKIPTPRLATSSFLQVLCGSPLHCWDLKTCTHRGPSGLSESNQGWKLPRVQRETRETSSGFAEQGSKGQEWKAS